MASVRLLNYLITFTCLVGLGLSLYSLFVELSFESDPNYEALCDISEQISCTKAFNSEYGKGFGIVHRIWGEDSILHQPNAVVGVIFYSLTAILAQFNWKLTTKITWYSVILSNFASIYFACILYFILRTLCVICVGTYVVNFVALILMKLKLKEVVKTTTQKKKGKSKKN